jgi:hypothetical protein
LRLDIIVRKTNQVQDFQGIESLFASIDCAITDGGKEVEIHVVVVDYDPENAWPRFNGKLPSIEFVKNHDQFKRATFYSDYVLALNRCRAAFVFLPTRTYYIGQKLF